MSISELTSDAAKVVVYQAKISGLLRAHQEILAVAEKEVATGDPLKVEIYGKQVIQSRAIVELIEENLL